MKKRLLLIAPEFFNYYRLISENLKCAGWDVVYIPDRPPVSAVEKIAFRKFRWPFEPMLNNYYARKLDSLGVFDRVLIVKGECITPKTMRKIKKSHCRESVTVYLWDSIKNSPGSKELVREADSVCTFDPHDAKEFDLKLLPLFFVPSSQSESQNMQMLPQYRMSFVGSVHGDRLGVISKIKGQVTPDAQRLIFVYFPSRILYYFRMFFDPAFKTFKKDELSLESMTKSQAEKIFVSSLAVLDIHHPGQSGLTMRTMESLALGRKLITTNDTIKDYPFYDARNICVVDRKNPRIPAEFLESLPDENVAVKMKAYELSHWVQNVLTIHKPLPKVKIARVATVPEAFVSIVDNLTEYQKSGFQVDLICSDGPYADYLKTEFGFNIIFCDIPRDISLIRDLKSVFRLAEIFKNNDYDIVHSHTPKAGLVTALAGVLARSKIRLHTFTGQRWVTLENPLKVILRLLDKLIVKLNTQCYADSPSQVEFLLSEGVGDSGEIKCLGNGSFGGVDFAKFSPIGREQNRTEISLLYSIPAAEVWCLFVGRIVKDKGVNELIQAHQIASKKHPYQLILVGPFEDELDPIDIETKNKILSDPTIHHLGFQKDPSYFMKAADFLCLPSYREGFGSVVIESAACGIPAIGTDIPGLRDAIIDKSTGVLVRKKEVLPLAEALGYFVRDSRAREQFGSSAFQRVKDNFDSEIMSKLQIDEYLKFEV